MFYSLRIHRHKDGEVLVHPMTPGDEDSYRRAALKDMTRAGWIPPKSSWAPWLDWERKNNYSILWVEGDASKNECKRHGNKDMG